MQSVFLHITNIVDEIDRRTHQTECDEGQCGTLEDCWLKQPAGGQWRREHEEVLDPLTGSHGADRGRYSVAANGNLRGFGHQDATLASHWEFGVTGERAHYLGARAHQEVSLAGGSRDTSCVPA